MKKKIGILALVLVLVLAGVGVGVARWSQTLQIEGNIDTGEVDWEFVQYSFIQRDNGLDWSCDPGMTNVQPLDKDVGWTTGVFSDEDDDGDLDLLTVTLNNVYPCYYNQVSADTHNNGTIPTKLCQCMLTYPDPYNPGQFITVPLPDSTLVYIVGENQYGGISNVIEIYWLNNTGNQMEPSDELEDSWKIHVLQAAKEGATYTFTITREAVQWNEYAP